MFVAIDIGNTTINVRQYEGERLSAGWRIASSPEPTEALLRQKFHRPSGLSVEGVIICSVVPVLTQRVAVASHAGYGCRPLLVGTDVHVPLINCYRRPEEVGQDRLVTAYAGQRQYGRPLIVVDFGTAITIDAVSRDAAYLGGVIVPGIQMSLESLAQRAALLPRVDLDAHRLDRVLGQSTKESITNGILFGFSDLCDGLIQRIKQEVGEEATVVATGGQSEIDVNHLKHVDYVNTDLIFDGLRYLATSAKTS